MQWTTSKIWAFVFPFLAWVLSIVATIMDHAAGAAIGVFSTVALFAGGVIVSKHRHQIAETNKEQQNVKQGEVI